MRLGRHEWGGLFVKINWIFIKDVILQEVQFPVIWLISLQIATEKRYKYLFTAHIYFRTPSHMIYSWVPNVWIRSLLWGWVSWLSWGILTNTNLKHRLYDMNTCPICISSNRPISLYPEYICSLSQNVPFRTKMCTFLFWMDHSGIWYRCILGFANGVNWECKCIQSS